MRASVRAAVEVPEQALEVILATLLAGGHLLIEDHPGVGKTMLARALAASVGGRMTRIEAMIDLLPGDIVGANVLANLRKARSHFSRVPFFRKRGAVGPRRDYSGYALIPSPGSSSRWSV